MSIKIVKTLVILLFASGAFAQKNNAYEKLVLDEYYSHLTKNDAADKTTHKYKIKKSGGIILACSAFDFSQIMALNEGKLPDMIFIVAKSGIFGFPLDTKSDNIIDKNTAIPLSNKKKFAGFVKGDTPILGIGKLKGNELVTFWISMIDVE